MHTSPESKWINTLLYSFGSDAPVEVYWGINEMIDWLNDKHKFQLKHLEEPYTKEYESDSYNEDQRVQEIIESLKILNNEH